MNKVLLFASLIGAMALSACKKSAPVYYAPREIVASAQVPQYKLHLEPMDLECMGVHDVVAVDSMIVVISSNKESMIQVFDYSGQPIAKLSPSGRAANEFLHVSYMDQNTLIDGDRYLYLRDLSDLYLYNLSASIRKGANVKPLHLKKIPYEADLATAFRILFRPDGSYFQYMGVSHNEIIIPESALQMNPDGSISFNPADLPQEEYYPPKYTLFKADSSKVEFNVFPQLPDFSNRNHARPWYHSYVRMSDDAKRVVAVDSYQDRMTFFDLESGDMFGVRCPDFADPAKYADSNEFPTSVKEGVMQVETYGDCIYVLYVHNTVEEYENDAPLDASIRVFRWDGTFIANIIPDAPIAVFSIDKSTGRLIAFDWDEQFFTADLDAIGVRVLAPAPPQKQKEINIIKKQLVQK